MNVAEEQANGCLKLGVAWGNRWSMPEWPMTSDDGGGGGGDADVLM